MINTIDLLTSDTYKVLKHMSNCQITLPNGDTYIPVSQVDLARVINVSTITMNKIFKELDKSDLMHSIPGKRGKYILTDKAFDILETLDSLQNRLEEVQ